MTSLDEPKKPGKPIASQFTNPPPGYEGPNRWMNWHGRRIEIGVGFSPFLLKEIEKRKRLIEACIFGVFGGAGKGKTYTALRLAEIIDRKFDPEIQVAFGPEAFLKLIGPDSPLKMGQVIIVDESQFAAGSRNWYNEIQKDLMAHLEAVRSKGFIIFIIALNIATLDVIARNYTLTHMIYMKKRGHGIAYRFYASPFGKEPYKNRLGTINMKLPGEGECKHPSCLRCQYSGIARRTADQLCMNIRARYERAKRTYLAEQARASEEKREAKQKLTVEEVKAILRANHQDIARATNGHLRTESIVATCKSKSGRVCTRPVTTQARLEWEIENPLLAVTAKPPKKP